MNKCPECNPNEASPWYEQPMNEEIREYARKYVSPVKMFYPSFEQAMEQWEKNDASS